MSKQIITNGKYKQATCKCGCIFVFDKTDLIKKEDNTYSVTCPQCDAEIANIPVKE